MDGDEYGYNVMRNEGSGKGTYTFAIHTCQNDTQREWKRKRKRGDRHVLASPDTHLLYTNFTSTMLLFKSH